MWDDIVIVKATCELNWIYWEKKIAVNCYVILLKRKKIIDWWWRSISYYSSSNIDGYLTILVFIAKAVCPQYTVHWFVCVVVKNSGGFKIKTIVVNLSICFVFCVVLLGKLK